MSVYPPADSARSWLAGDAVCEEPVVGLRGQLRPRPPGHDPHLHGPADQRRHREPQGEQT